MARAAHWRERFLEDSLCDEVRIAAMAIAHGRIDLSGVEIGIGLGDVEVDIEFRMAGNQPMQAWSQPLARK